MAFIFFEDEKEFNNSLLSLFLFYGYLLGFRLIKRQKLNLNHMKKIVLILAVVCGLFGIAVAQPVPSYVPVNGLVGWWPFNGNANDESGNGHNGAVYGATLTDDRFGSMSSAYYFNGTSDYIESNDIGLPAGGDLYSFNAWVFIDQPQNNSWCTILSYGTNNNTNADDGKSCEFWLTSNANSTQIISNNYRGRANRGEVDSINYRGVWHMITFLKPIGDSLGTWYFDGQPIPTTDQIIQGTTRNIVLSGILKIGRALTNVSPYEYYWYGKLDDIGIWNRLLTQQEINNLYNASPPPPCSPLAANLNNGLVGYWPFCGNANDESGNGNNGTVNGATLYTDRFGNSNSAYSFNSTGSGNNITVPNSASLNFNGDLSFSLWVKTTSIIQNAT
ncbi:MAG: hypothetical protein RIQ47_1445, partial [Bacteroidota bacterium]